MKKAWILALLLLLAAGRARAAPSGDPRERNFKLLVDGVEIGGVVGYRIEFARNPATRDDQRRLVITVTQKGLAQLQDWLNGATDTAAPAAKAVEIQARDNQDEILARWSLTAVVPSTFNSAAAGNINEVDSTVEFLFDRLRLIEARAK
jgi:hypothetical protein